MRVSESVTGGEAILIEDLRGGPGNLSLTWTGAGDSMVEIYRSTNLVEWGAPIATEVSTGSYVDIEAPAGSAFYVVVPAGTPPP